MSIDRLAVGSQNDGLGGASRGKRNLGICIFTGLISIILLLSVVAEARAEPMGSQPKPSLPAKRASPQLQDGGEGLDQQIARLKARLDKVIADARAQGVRPNEVSEEASKTEGGNAQGAPTELTSSEGGGGESPSEPSEGARRRLPSFRGDTPDERARLTEERKRISAAAASFGTDPTAIIGYYELTYGHAAFTNNLRLDIATAEVRVPVTPNWLLRVTVPYVWADLNGPRGFSTNGLSDTLVRTGGRLYADPNVALFIGMDATFPTATNRQLGTGKYTLGPGGAVAVPLARLRSLFIILVQDFNSVGGDPSRRNIHFMQVQSAVNTIWSERWWSTGSLQWAMDWNQNRKTTMNLQGEIGHRLDQHWNLFAGAGAGVVGKDTFLGLDWSVQAGVRWMFSPGSLFANKIVEGLPID